MNLPADLATLSGLDQLRADFAGRSGYEGHGIGRAGWLTTSGDVHHTAL
jgi:hypothetical protein